MRQERAQSFQATSVSEAYDRFVTPQLMSPLARDLIGRAKIKRGSSVLDVASGSAVVARLAAESVGPEGRVVASDVSPAMLAVAASKPVEETWAPIEYLECSAMAIEAADDSFDTVLCQHGLQFLSDRAAALEEMGRVTRPGGTVVVSTWAAEYPLGLFGPMLEALAEAGIDEPYPHAFVQKSYCLGAEELRELLAAAALHEVVVETVELDAVWPDTEDAVSTVLGTPFGPAVSALAPERQEEVRDRFVRGLGHSADGPVTARTTTHVGRGNKG